MKRCGLIAFALVLAFGAVAGEPAEISSLAADASAMAPEGVWRMQPGGALFRVEAGTSAGRYEVFVVESPDFSVAPGARMGSMTAMASAGVYDAEFAENPGAAGSRTHHFIIEVDDEAGRMSMRPYRARAGVSFRRWLSYLFRVGIVDSDRPDGHDGAVRISPSPSGPVVL